MAFAIRLATPDEAETVVEHRRSMFTDMGHRDQAAMDTMCAAFRPWLEAKMRSGEYLAWFAIAGDGTVAAGLGLWLMDWPPHLVGGVGRRGNIVNVYTRPECRRRGLARSLVQTSLDWCRGNGIGCVVLHASAEGRPLYEALGFGSTNEMRLIVNG